MMIFLQRYSFLSALTLFSILSVWSLGYTLDGYFLAMICFWVVINKLSKILFNIIFITNLVVCSLFAPIGMLYGRLNIGLIASALETKPNETKEFLSTLPWQGLALGVIVFACGILVIYANKQQTANSKQQTANSKQQTANSKQQTANSKILNVAISYCY